MILRDARLDEIPQMVANGRAFAEAAYPEIPYDEASFIKCIHQMHAERLLIVAEEDGVHLGGVGALTGTICINENVKVASERFWWVKPDQRAAGVGKSLLIAIEEASKEAGCQFQAMIALHNQDFPMIDGFYKKAGYRCAEHMYMKALT